MPNTAIELELSPRVHHPSVVESKHMARLQTMGELEHVYEMAEKQARDMHTKVVCTGRGIVFQLLTPITNLQTTS